MTRREALALLRSRDHQLEVARREIRKLQKDCAHMLELHNPAAQAVVRIAMRRYAMLLKDWGDLDTWLKQSKLNAANRSLPHPRSATALVLACARLAKARKGARHG